MLTRSHRCRHQALRQRHRYQRPTIAILARQVLLRPAPHQVEALQPGARCAEHGQEPRVRWNAGCQARGPVQEGGRE